MVVVLLGESGSGKSTVADLLVRDYGYERIVTYTTRPPRDGEKDKVDYNFVTEEEFDYLYDKGFFAETAYYNGWFYASPKSYFEYSDIADKNYVIILTPSGLRNLKREFDNRDKNYISIYLKISREDRLIRLLKRGDNIEEAYRRNLTDVGQFDGIENEVDVTLNTVMSCAILSPNTLAELISNNINADKLVLTNNTK